MLNLFYDFGNDVAISMDEEEYIKIVIGFSFNFTSQCRLFVKNSHTDKLTP